MKSTPISRVITAILALFIFTAGIFASAKDAFASNDKGIALTLKVNGEVKYTKNGTKQNVPLKFGTVLDDGDKIQTGKDGYAILIFTDDKSQIKLTSMTEVTIEGKRDANANISKRIALEVGQVLAKVQQQKGTLQIATPTSVASVKGTEFWVVVYEDGTTQVVTLEGLVELINTQSGRIVDVKPGQRGESKPGGDVNTGNAPKDEIPKDPEPESVPPHSIDVEVKDPDGRSRHIIIDFEQKH